MNESQIISFALWRGFDGRIVTQPLGASDLLRREMSKSHSEMLHRLADLATRLTRVRARAIAPAEVQVMVN